MPRLLFYIFYILITLSFLLVHALGQSKIKEIVLIYKPDASDQRNVEVEFVERVVDKDNPEIPKAPLPGQVSLVTRKNGTPSRTLKVSKVDCTKPTCLTLSIEFEKESPPDSEDTEVEITFSNLPFKNEIQRKLTAVGKIYTKKNLGELRDLSLQQQKEAVAKIKTTEERNIFAGFSVAAPADGGGVGNGEINLNHWVSPSLFLSLNLKKSSAEKADPKQFNIGMSYRKVFLLRSKAMKEVDSAIDAFEKNPSIETRNKMQEHLNNVRSSVPLGFLIDASGRIEAEALNFNVTNAVLDLPIYLVSRTQNIGGRENAYFNYRILPAGVELGRNLNNENTKMEKYYIGRFKYGGEVSFVYDPGRLENSLIKRVEFSAQAVDRYLFRKETAFDQKTKMAAGISEGRKPWYQFDLKVFLGETPQGRFGFKLSRIRGMLPPTFSDTKAFTFGAIFESAEDKKD